VKLFSVLTMGRINECCNPLKKAKHNHVRSNLILIHNKQNAKFKKFINLYMCRPCKKAIYKPTETELNSTLEKKELKKKESENVCVDECEQKSVDDSTDPKAFLKLRIMKCLIQSLNVVNQEIY